MGVQAEMPISPAGWKKCKLKFSNTKISLEKCLSLSTAVRFVTNDNMFTLFRSF